MFHTLCAHFRYFHNMSCLVVYEEQEEHEEDRCLLCDTLGGINGAIRVDFSTGKTSIVDAIQGLCPSSTKDYALRMMNYVISKGDGVTKYHVDYLKLNGSGEATPVCEIQVLLRIIWMLPCFTKKQLRRRLDKLAGEERSREFYTEMEKIADVFENLSNLGKLRIGSE